jgi:DNA-binding HxlR family transcriptional regulator
MADWSKQFPFWSQKTLSRTISSLEKQGLVISGNYNQKGYDRTKWYTIDYDALELLEKDEPETEESGEFEEEALRENGDSVSDQSIETDCPYEENQGLTGNFDENPQNDRFIETSCPHPLGQSVPMESDNLSASIPEKQQRFLRENNNNEYVE